MTSVRMLDFRVADPPKPVGIIRIPMDVAVSAASLGRSVAMLQKFSIYQKVFAGWSPQNGWEITVPLDSPGAQGIMDLDLPLAVHQTAQDKERVEVLYVDPKGVVVIEPQQAVTGQQLAELVRRYPMGQVLRVIILENCLAICFAPRAHSNHFLDARSLIGCIKVKYGAAGVIDAVIPFNTSGVMMCPRIIVCIKHARAGFQPNVVAAGRLTDFSHVEVNTATVSAIYEGAITARKDPSELHKHLYDVSVQFAKELGIHPAIDGFQLLMEDQHHIGLPTERRYALSIRRHMMLASDRPATEEK